jgi:sterol desaturase/sphingolipid hydroxylase (fatty acid hydroxylase superfamily)
MESPSLTEHISGPAQQSAWSVALSWMLWPLLAAACCAGTAYGLSKQIDGSIILTVEFLGLAAALEILERVFPHESRWGKPDGLLGHDVVFTLLGSGLPGALAQALVLALTVSAAQWIVHQSSGGLWPTHWPLAFQIALTLLIADFGGYWTHRLFHTVSWMWPYHAVHHTVPRLWWLNSGRAHPLDIMMIIATTTPVLFLLSAPENIIVWLGSFTTFIGMISHCNVNMRCGPLDWVFNTPNMHRWHHSRVLAEGNSNYGENTMIWDVVFGTHYRQSRRRPPADVGTDTPIPTSISGQFVAPLKLSREAFKASRKA